MLTLAIPVGLLVGLSLGALGGGGSILTVPALVYLLGEDAHGATTASLIIVGLSALVGSITHARAGRVRVASGVTFGVVGIVGSFLGSRLSARIDSNVLLVAFGGLLVVAAAAVARRALAMARLGRRPLAARCGGGGIDAPPAGSPGEARSVIERSTKATAALEDGARARRPLRLVVAASVVGLLTGFFGVGGGFVVVPALVLALGLEMPVAVGTSLLVIAINSATGLLSRTGTHPSLDWSLVAMFALGASVGSLLGTRLAGRVRPERLGIAFAMLLVLVSVYTTARSLPRVV